MLSTFLTSNTRAEIMRILFDGRELERLGEVTVSSIQKEVKRLQSIDLVKARRDGNRVYYRANRDHPLYGDLVSIVEKTVGIVALLKKRLQDQRIKCAFLFGSLAKDLSSLEEKLSRLLEMSMSIDSFLQKAIVEKLY